MGMMLVPNESRLQVRRAPNVLDKVIKWRKAKPSKEQQEAKRIIRKGIRSSFKMIKEIYNGDDGWD